MGVETKIQWCHHTWNPWRGCEHDGPECDNCYAELLSLRNPTVLGIWGAAGTRAIAAEDYWKLPYKWDKAAGEAGERRRVFCLSLGDWLEDRPEMVKPRKRLFTTIRQTENLDWLLLTKRPQNFEKCIVQVMRCFDEVPSMREAATHVWLARWLAGTDIPENVWVGVSCGDREHGLPRVDALRSIPAALRFVSAEPLLEDLGRVNLGGIDWVIIGGESGRRARPCAITWIESLIKQCRFAGVAPFVKQWGTRPTFCAPLLPSIVTDVDWNTIDPVLKDKKGGDPEEWPERIRVRELPR